LLVQKQNHWYTIFMKKLRVGVLRGGPSSEYAVSIATGGAVLQNLPKEKYDTEDIFISREGEWHVAGIPRTHEEALRGIDVVFNALHGTYGENGGAQNVIEQFNIPYTGSRALAGALALHKPRARNMLERQKINMPRGHVAYRGGSIQKTAHMVFELFTPPWVVKPVNEGSSTGIKLAFSVPELIKALEDSFAEREAVLIEEYVRGEEVSTFITEGKNNNLYILPPVRIKRDGYIFTHEEKSIEGNHTCDIPFSQKVVDEIKHITKRAHNLLGLRHYSRADLIVTPGERVYLLEINALPSLAEHTPTNHALFEARTNLPEFLDHVITVARK
jgi:D-alanine-D-alanine ligase